jgi:hypothetical protein
MRDALTFKSGSSFMEPARVKYNFVCVNFLLDGSSDMVNKSMGQCMAVSISASIYGQTSHICPPPWGKYEMSGRIWKQIIWKQPCIDLFIVRLNPPPTVYWDACKTCVINSFTISFARGCYSYICAFVVFQVMYLYYISQYLYVVNTFLFRNIVYCCMCYFSIIYLV